MADRARSFLIWGAGGHGRVVADLIRCAGHRVVGFIDRDAMRMMELARSSGSPIMIEESAWIERMHDPHRTPEAGALALGLGDNVLRYDCLELAASMETPVLIHPASTVSPSALLGPATVVLAGAVINAAARLGRAVIVNSGAIVEHDCVIGDAVHLSPGAILCGTVHVGDRSWIGAAAVVIPHVRIGTDATIGAGAVVIRDVPDGATVAGNPARDLHVLSEVAP